MFVSVVEIVLLVWLNVLLCVICLVNIFGFISLSVIVEIVGVNSVLVVVVIDWVMVIMVKLEMIGSDRLLSVISNVVMMMIWGLFFVWLIRLLVGVCDIRLMMFVMVRIMFIVVLF